MARGASGATVAAAAPGYFIVGMTKSARTAAGSGQRCVTVLRRV